MEDIITRIIAFFKEDDKQKHIFAIALIASWAFIIMLAFIPKWWAFVVAIIVAVIAGYGKEYIIDVGINDGKADPQDLYADAVGLVLATIVMLIYLLN